ncbi:hypothetical protein SAMN05518672_102606 [Chitinophaga sp. CF118]|uniref:hypothetical protein n=1 Tax=Chitinophaga sp. CF118 TaxID=1884367 RepID=UPI0008E06874|nr:hypothetical protein [Chitinophaga sp. CF118]SFD61032.1 hypothetical protein SAMN05518672_102606 [Chitinophaga sp. CF118]
MILFNILLLIHFITFIGYLAILFLLWPKHTEVLRDKKGMILGIIILLTGIGLAILKYPHINYFKVVPKITIFVAIAIINGIYDNKPFTKTAYYTLLGLTLLAACIAVVKV